MAIKKFLVLSISVLVLLGCTPNVDPEPEPPNGELPGDPFETRRIHADGIWFDLPIAFQVFVDAGWFPDVIQSVEDELAKTIAPRTYVQKYYIRNERYVMALTLFNPTDETITIKDAMVGEVEAENRKWLKDDILDFKVDDVITFASTQDDFKALWGEPDHSVTEGLYEVWTYQHNTVSFTKIYWDVSTGVVFRIIVSNMK